MYDYEHGGKLERFDGVFLGKSPVSVFYRPGLAQKRLRCHSFKKPSKWPATRKVRRPGRILIEGET